MYLNGSIVTISYLEFPGLTNRLIKRKVIKMKVKIDYDLCMGDRNCNKLCPEVFDYDVDQLQARVIVDEVPEQYQDLVRQAAAECAPGAIIVEE